MERRGDAGTIWRRLRPNVTATPPRVTGPQPSTAEGYTDASHAPPPGEIYHVWRVGFEEADRALTAWRRSPPGALEWDTGKAVLHLGLLALDGDDVVPLYLGDDEHAFEALGSRGVGIFVGDPRDPELGGRSTAAAFALTSPDEVERFLRWLVREEISGDFLLEYQGFEPAHEALREALRSTGNGYFCTRGCAEWEDADRTHYPGTYAHGIYNRSTTVMGAHPVPSEDLVNLSEPARAQGAHRRGPAHPPGRRRVALLPARVRHPQCGGDARAALWRSRRPRDRRAEPPLREDARDAPGGARLGSHTGELAGAVRDRLGA
jgi:hypothetical protein